MNHIKLIIVSTFLYYLPWLTDERKEASGFTTKYPEAPTHFTAQISPSPLFQQSQFSCYLSLSGTLVGQFLFFAQFTEMPWRESSFGINLKGMYIF